jgi:hypothetical protein
MNSQKLHNKKEQTPVSTTSENPVELEKALDIINIIRTGIHCIDAPEFFDPDKYENLSGEPVIVGGAARDMLFGKAPKDYDIFVPVAKNYLVAASVNLAESLLAHNIRYTVENNTQAGYALNGYCRPEMLGVISCPTHKVDIVFFDQAYGRSPEKIVDTFDNSLSKAWIQLVNNKMIALATTEFQLSAQTKHIETYKNVPTRSGHLLRVLEKYPTFTMSIHQPKLWEEMCHHMECGLVNADQLVQYQGEPA